MKDTHILVFEHDILKYPPILSIIEYLFLKGKRVVLLGYCTDKVFLDNFESRGGEFYNVVDNNLKSSKVKKILRYRRFQGKVKSIIKAFDNEDIKIWLFGEQCTWMLHNLPFYYDCNIYLFETPSFNVGFRYRLLAINLVYEKTLKAATNVICCEYNRAHITKSFFKLDKLPIIIPNKPFVKISSDDSSLSESLKRSIGGKKLILYQGIFNYPERKMDEFCEAIKFLPNDYVLCLMGTENDYKLKLKEKYESDRVIFLPYISAPDHLAITKMAYIGLLVYNGEGGNIKNTLNTLYCAPNKVFEYSRFGVPMISNDLPALQHIFGSYTNGICINELTPNKIAEVILSISNNYDLFAKNSSHFYDSIDMVKLYNKVI